MRKTFDQQRKFGEVDISNIQFDLRSRDEIPKLLIGLQHIYCTPELRTKVFNILKEIIPDGVDSQNGRPGMELWKILVLGVIRLNCNWDYDKLKEIADNHKTVRCMLGHSGWEDETTYPLQTLKDNVSLLTPEVLDRISQVVVSAGHQLVKKTEHEELTGKCDSFVVETDVHFPTDINLLFDGFRRAVTLIAMLCSMLGVSGWRQSRYSIRKVKKLFRKIQKLKHSTSKDSDKQAQRADKIIIAHEAYIELVEKFLFKVKESIQEVRKQGFSKEEKLQEIEGYMAHAHRQIDQIKRRVVQGETIPHSEKVFSLFEEHTEWISKGKAGVSQELGLRVCILKDQHGFILFHHVMEKVTDEKVAVLMVEEAQKRFPELSGCSFDKGFYTPSNRVQLSRLLNQVTLPKKGRLSSKDKEIEESEAFILFRRKHSEVESAINALENHGLDRCPDHGIDGFKRYVALSILARNIQHLGHLLQQKQFKIYQRNFKSDQSNLKAA